MAATRQYIFNLYFNFKGDASRERTWASREGALAYLKRLFENKAQFACIAKDENKNGSSLMLRGYMKLKSPCTPIYAKRLLGKYSSCKPSYFGDMVSLCRFVHIDRDLTVTGKLHGESGSNKNLKSFNGDPKLIVKVLLDSIDNRELGLNGAPCPNLNNDI